MEWFVKCLKNYVNFSGRARRKEYWMFTLVSMIISTALSIVGAIILPETFSSALSGLYSLAVLLPTLAVGARRLHDTGKSALWLLLLLTCIGVFVLIYFFVVEGDEGDNEYGPDPKEFSEGSF